MKYRAKTSMLSVARVCLAILIASFFVGCAGAMSQQYVPQSVANEPISPPPVLLVYDFAVDPEDVVVDMFGPSFARKQPPDSERLKKGKAIASLLTKVGVEMLLQQGIPAQAAVPSTPVPVNALVAKGQFISIEEGDQTKRMVIGLGIGSGKLQARSQGYWMTETGLKQFTGVVAETHGSKIPGLGPAGASVAAAGAAVGIVVAGGMQLKSEVIGDDMETHVKNLATEFVKNVVAFYKRKGWM
jgi:Domain of unknown function (DUF4410)